MMAWHEVLPLLDELQAPVVQKMGSALSNDVSVLDIPG